MLLYLAYLLPFHFRSQRATVIGEKKKRIWNENVEVDKNEAG